MKKFSLLLIILFTSLVFSQTEPVINFIPIYIYTYEDDSTIYEFEYSACLKPMLDDFFSNKRLSKLDLTNLCNLKGIYHSIIEGYYAGAYGINQPIHGTSYSNILINTLIPEYLPTFLTAILYHEMYHQFLPTVEHCKSKCCHYIFKDGSTVTIEHLIKTFDASEKRKYFKYIRRKQRQLGY